LSGAMPDVVEKVKVNMLFDAKKVGK